MKVANIVASLLGVGLFSVFVATMAIEGEAHEKQPSATSPISLNQTPSQAGAPGGIVSPANYQPGMVPKDAGKVQKPSLDLTVSPSQEALRIGDTLSIKVTVTNHVGKPLLVGVRSDYGTATVYLAPEVSYSQEWSSKVTPMNAIGSHDVHFSAWVGGIQRAHKTETYTIVR